MMIDRRCPMCRKLFKVSESRLKHGRGIHCSAACQYAANRNKLSKPILAVCIGCGGSFETCPSKLRQAKGAGKFCSRPCRDRYWVGPLNPNWQGAGRIYARGPHWQKIKRAIVSRDQVCQHCGTDGQLHVHHAIPFRMFDNADEANHPNNLIALCPPCHRREDAKRKWVKLPEGGGVITMQAGGAAWQLARERRLV